MVMEPLGRAVAKAPAVFIVVILVLTGVFGFFTSQTSFESTEEDFNPDSEVAQASQRVSDYFGPGVETVQVITRDPAGNSGDVLRQEPLLAILELEERIVAPEAGDIDITDTLQPTQSVPTGVQSIADLVAMAAMTLQGAELFGVEMANTTSMLNDLNETMAMIALGIIYMDHGDNESVGSNLTQTEYALGQIVDMLQGMGGNGGNGGNGNGGIGFPDLATIRQVLEAMDDTAVKGTIVGMNNFDSTPLEMVVAGTVTARETTRTTAEPTSGTVGSPINGLLMDEAFMAGNYTFMGFPVDHEMLMLDSLAHLQFIYLALGQITGFEAQPFVLANVLTGLSAGLGFVLATDYDVSSMQPSSKASLMIVQQNRSVDSDRALESQYDLEGITKGVERENEDTIEFGVMGAQIMFDKINTSSMESLGTLMGLAMVFIVVILFLVFRSGLDTFLTLIALVFVIIWTFGIGIILGYTFNPLTTAVPILLVGLAVDYGIHLTVRYRLEKRRETLDRSTVLTIASVGTALLLATITTVFSFMSNMLSDLSVMRQFGILTSVGIISAFFVMNTFVPAARLLYDRRRERLGKRRGGKGKKGDGPRKENMLVNFVQLGAHGAARYSTPIVVGSLLLSAGAFYAISDIETTFDFMDFLPEDLPETKTINFLLNNFNFSSSTTDVLVEGDIATANVFASMRTTQDNLVDVRDVIKVGDTADARSPLTVVQKYGLPTSPAFVPELGTAFAASDTNGDGVPDTGVPALLDTYMAHPSSAGEMRGVLHPDEDGGYDAAIIRVGVRDAPDNGAKLTEQMNDAISPLESLKDADELDEAIVTGGPVVTYVTISAINTAGLESVMATIIAAAILLMISYFVAFRTIVVGLLTTIPIVLVIGWVFGSMLLMDIPLNVVTITVAALTVGLGITYAIHISHRFLEDVKEQPWKDAMCETVGHTGAALFGAAATTIGGFGMLTFSILPPMAQFGIVTALSILYSFLASVFVLPSFLAIWARWKFGDDGGDMCDMPQEKAAETQDTPGEGPD